MLLSSRGSFSTRLHGVFRGNLSKVALQNVDIGGDVQGVGVGTCTLYVSMSNDSGDTGVQCTYEVLLSLCNKLSMEPSSRCSRRVTGGRGGGSDCGGRGRRGRGRGSGCRGGTGKASSRSSALSMDIVKSGTSGPHWK